MKPKTIAKKRVGMKCNAYGYTCVCGKTHEYQTYMYAHWHDKIKHTCECCGRVAHIQNGVAQ